VINVWIICAVNNSDAAWNHLMHGLSYPKQTGRSEDRPVQLRSPGKGVSQTLAILATYILITRCSRTASCRFVALRCAEMRGHLTRIYRKGRASDCGTSTRQLSGLGKHSPLTLRNNPRTRCKLHIVRVKSSKPLTLSIRWHAGMHDLPGRCVNFYVRGVQARAARLIIIANTRIGDL
jgi:hypothetical protein